MTIGRPATAAPATAGTSVVPATAGTSVVPDAAGTSVVPATARGTPLAWVFGFVAVASIEVACSWRLASGGPLRAGHWSLPIVAAGWTAAFAVAAALAFRLPPRAAPALIVAAGIALRVAALAGPPTTSDDLYRYSWDGRVQAAGVDPYASPPDAPQLAALREPWLWPDAATCHAMGKGAPCTRINRPSDRTIYPPAAEAWFALVYKFAGVGARYKTWQVAGLLAEVGTLGLLVVALRRWHRDPRWVALYALCPAPVIEFVNNGHVDALAVVLIVAALVVAAPRAGAAAERWRSWRFLAAAGLLSIAFLVKVYPGVLLLPLAAHQAAPRLRAVVRAGTVLVVVAALAYLPHVVRVGAKVLGYLPGYLSEEHYHSGGRFLIANVLQVPDAWAGAASAVGFIAVAAWILVRRPALPAASAALLAALLLAASPAQSWYAVALVAVAALAARPAYLVVAAAAYAASWSVVLDQRAAPAIGGWAFTAALAFLVVASISRRGAEYSA
ncbi:MAG TPA: glycosyltransferase 87 family protein [Acidimicrobiales bacterium]|jgi:hypothetical protein|nr:glycosyltransferase 87 family protein [Acidimicrobiales bacterium]